MQKRKFSSYGTVVQEKHYYAPRLKLIDKGRVLLEDGNYITVWASRQSGKSTTLIDIQMEIEKRTDEFFVIGLSAEALFNAKNTVYVMNYFVKEIEEYIEIQLKQKLNKKCPVVKTEDDFIKFFSKKYFPKKLILVIDEFDGLDEYIISELTHTFRKIYLMILDPKTTEKPTLHSLALIGIRSVLGIENQKGSPFNIQNSLRIPHLTYDEVNQMCHDYIKEHNQIIDQDVIDILFYETQGQPGLVSWFGELLTDTFNKEKDKSIAMNNWKYVYIKVNSLPSTHLSNLISKVNETEETKDFVVNLFQTKTKIPFVFRKKIHNHLYLNGVIKPEEGLDENGNIVDYIKFTCQFIQRQLFEYYADEFINFKGNLLSSNPFMELDHIFGDDYVNIDEVIKVYQEYIDANKEHLFKDSSRRKDLRRFEAVYHFDIYAYLSRFFQSTGIQIHPEFPTGNGKIDLILRQRDNIYGIELKTYTRMYEYKVALEQAAKYAKQLNIDYITLVFFVEERISKEDKDRLEKSYFDNDTKIEVKPRLILV